MYVQETGNVAQLMVIGVGGGGGNATNYMYENHIEGVDFVICNTDRQALRRSPIPPEFHIHNYFISVPSIKLVAFSTIGSKSVKIRFTILPSFFTFPSAFLSALTSAEPFLPT